jgi:hypothetical protein
MTTVDKPLLAWHGSAELKADAVARMRAHREADTFIQGSYLEHDPRAARKYRGCFHGCLTTEVLAAERGVPVEEIRGYETRWCRAAKRLFGIPYSLADAFENVFERQESFKSAGEFAVEVTEAIPVGADLSGVLEAATTSRCSCGCTAGIWTAESLIEALKAAPVPGATR